MIQAVFFALLIVALTAGYFTYFPPSQKFINPMGFMMDKSGLNTVDTRNRKRIQQINMTTSGGITQIRRQMDDLAIEQNKFLDTIQEQRQILQNANKDANDVLLEAQRQGQKGDKDILRLEALASEMQDQQRLLVAKGRDLIALNDQLSKSRQEIAQQIDLANINTQTSLGTLQQRYASLQNRSSGFFDKVTEHNQEARDQMARMQDKLRHMADKAAGSKDRIQHMLDKVHENMIKLADLEERNRNSLQDAREKLANSQELSSDSVQHAKDLIEKERQKQEDRESMIQQRIADQKQRQQDSQDRQNK